MLLAMFGSEFYLYYISKIINKTIINKIVRLTIKSLNTKQLPLKLTTNFKSLTIFSLLLYPIQKKELIKLRNIFPLG